MKILFDTNTPAPLARSLLGHEVIRTGDLGWQSLENGVLLSAAEDRGFDVIVTCDQNVPLQQNLADRKIALVVLSTNHWPTMRSVADRIAAKIDFAQTGQVLWVDVAALSLDVLTTMRSHGTSRLGGTYLAHTFRTADNSLGVERAQATSVLRFSIPQAEQESARRSCAMFVAWRGDLTRARLVM